MEQLPDWSRIEVNGIQQLQRLFAFNNFVEALAFTNKVGELAEAEGHHPALLTEWGRVTVTWWSHSVGGVSEKDFRMAAQIRHFGRHSGRHYVTPAGARRSWEVIVIPLTFGNQSDWARNVRAADGCSIRLGGRDYQATQPEFVSADDAGPLVRSAFGPLERASFRMLGIRQFMTLHIMSAEP